MKTLKQVEAEEIADVYTLEEFIELLNEGYIIDYDGIGYFHNGENETNISVWDHNLTWDDVKNFPYVCWYNK